MAKKNQGTYTIQGTYQHYRGKSYEVIGMARHTETKEDLIIYRGLYDDPELGKKPLFARPKDLFFGAVIVNKKVLPRFKTVD